METDNVVLEHLRSIWAKVDRIDRNVDELRELFVSFRVREHTTSGDNLVRDRKISNLEDEVERIKRRLDLVD